MNDSIAVHLFGFLQRDKMSYDVPHRAWLSPWRRFVFNPPCATAQVRSIECKRQSVKEVNEGQSATFAVRSLNRRVALRRSTFRKVREVWSVRRVAATDNGDARCF